MRMPRMTTRRWMIVVAIVGLLMSVRCPAQAKAEPPSVSSSISRAAGGFRSEVGESRKTNLFGVPRADRRAREARALQRSRARSISLGGPEIRLDQSRSNLARWTNRIAYYAAMTHKYQYAARYPWLPVEPDPPEPE